MSGPDPPLKTAWWLASHGDIRGALSAGGMAHLVEVDATNAAARPASPDLGSGQSAYVPTQIGGVPFWPCRACTAMDRG